MEGHDWQNCPENVFEIYNSFGNTHILSHYPVGLYFPEEKVWFSMEGGKGRKTSCPGKPNLQTGFEKSEHWKNCHTAIFQMIAKGRKPGDRIENGDAVFLYCTTIGRYVRIESTGTPILSDCPRVSKNPFDDCYNEVLQLTIE